MPRVAEESMQPTLEMLVGHALARVDEADEVCDRLATESKQAVQSLETRVEALETQNSELRNLMQQLQLQVQRLCGMTCADAKAAGYVEGLKAAGYSLQAAKEAGYSQSELQRAGYSCAEFKAAEESQKADFVAPSSRLETTEDTDGPISWKQHLFGLFVESDEAFKARAEKESRARAELARRREAEALKADLLSGLTLKQLRTKGHVVGLKAAGVSCAEAKAAGYTMEEVKADGYTAKEANAAGYTMTIAQAKAWGFVEGLKAGGFSIQDVMSVRYTLVDVMAGYSAAQIQAALQATSLKEMKAAGYSCSEAKAAGYMPWECSEAGYSYQEGCAAGYRYDRHPWFGAHWQYGGGREW